MGCTGSKEPADPNGSKPQTQATTSANTNNGTSAAPSGEVQEYKILLIGDKGVGKTSFLLRIMSDKFIQAASSAEPGADAYTKERMTKELVIDGAPVKVTLIDAGSVDQFRVISSSIYTEAEGVLMMFSFDSLPSLQNCRATWFRQTDRYCRKGETQILLVGNKSDVADKQVDESRMQSLASELEISSISNSAKENTNVSETLAAVVRAIRKEREKKAGRAKDW